MHVIFINSEFITINLPCDNAVLVDFQRKMNSLSRAAKTPTKKIPKGYWIFKVKNHEHKHYFSQISIFQKKLPRLTEFHKIIVFYLIDVLKVFNLI